MTNRCDNRKKKSSCQAQTTRREVKRGRMREMSIFYSYPLTSSAKGERKQERGYTLEFGPPLHFLFLDRKRERKRNVGKKAEESSHSPVLTFPSNKGKRNKAMSKQERRKKDKNRSVYNLTLEAICWKQLTPFLILHCDGLWEENNCSFSCLSFVLNNRIEKMVLCKYLMQRRKRRRIGGGIIRK